jgi:multisubunit Na+/H+ antiporter MnhB subunit
MSVILTDVDAWVIAVSLAALMLAAWAFGWRRGRPRGGEKRDETPSKFNDAVLALLGLLLAFTFSMSLSRHEQRRQMVVTDSNAIGDFLTTVSLLKDPTRGQLQAVVRHYVEHRLFLAQNTREETTLQRQLDEIQAMHRQMESLVKEAVDEGTPVIVPLVNTLNELTSAHASRLSAMRDRVPPSVVLLLVLAAVISMLVMGWQQGMIGEWHPAAAVGFTALVCLVLWVTLDLNQPQRGWITVSQEPLEQLLKEMEK